MMSDLPGEMTKQIFRAPPRIIRSTRYSLTAQGRSVPPSKRLPTGSNSLEKASGWMRLPRPAAGTMPHISRPHHRARGGLGGKGRFEASQKIAGPLVGRMLRQNTLAGICRDLLKLCIGQGQRGEAVECFAHHKDFLARPEEGLQAFPRIGEDSGAARGGLKKAAGGAPAHLCHRLARDIEGEAGGGEERRVLAGRQVADEVD